MGEAVSVPLWLFLAIAAFALWSLLDRLVYDPQVVAAANDYAKAANLPRGDRDYAFHVGLRMLALRRLIEESAAGLFSAVATERAVPAYYANAIAHLRRP